MQFVRMLCSQFFYIYFLYSVPELYEGLKFTSLFTETRYISIQNMIVYKNYA
jgi:hypothetical protein